MRAIAPVADEFAVVPGVLDHQIGEAECQRAVRARAHAQPDIRLAREAGTAGIDGKHLQPPLPRPDPPPGVGRPGGGGGVAPPETPAPPGPVPPPPARPTRSP